MPSMDLVIASSISTELGFEEEFYQESLSFIQNIDSPGRLLPF
jgi:hypothetical protein